MSRDVVVTSENAGFLQNVSIGPHRFQADESVEVGGCDAGPDPYELLLAALGACTAMTVRVYANRKQWPLEAVRVRLMRQKIHAEDCSTVKPNKDLLIGSKERSCWPAPLSDLFRDRSAQKPNVWRNVCQPIRLLMPSMRAISYTRAVTKSKRKAQGALIKRVLG